VAYYLANALFYLTNDSGIGVTLYDEEELGIATREHIEVR
jgi:hypothetical protein